MKDDYILILRSAKENKRSNEAWLKQIRKVNNEEFYNKLSLTHQKVFEKTDCLSCANCCKSSPPLISNNDINRISKHLNISTKQFNKLYVLTDVNGEKSFNLVPCRFLNADNTCSIYEIRPEACRRFPHTDEKEYQQRVGINLANTLICPAASQILLKLKSIWPYDI